MFKFEIVAENATELKTKIADLALLFDVGEDPRITLAKRVNKVEGVPIDVIKKLELVEKSVNGVAEATAEISEEAEEKIDEPETSEEETEENIATKMTYWLSDGEFGSSRKGAVIPDEAKVFGSKSAWDAAKEQREEADEEEESTTKTNFPVEDAEPVDKSTIIDKMGELLRANGSVKKEIVGLMARFDGSRFSEIAEKDYPEFYAGLMSIEKGGE